MADIEVLQRKLEQLQRENETLRQENDRLTPKPHTPDQQKPDSSNHNLSLEEYRRYGRQMIVPGFGSLEAQMALKNSSILVIGAGGLGCPALLYLCGAGIGRIGILDNDVVDTSNLHRQVLHTTENVGMLKCDSAKQYLSKLNPNVDIVTHPLRLVNDNAFDIIAPYDLVVDCTDTPATRYLINDVCVLLGKTIVSGSGVKSDGQFTILNYANTGPCYRCFYPQAPKPESVSTCGDAGVLGPAIGLTGVALATETIKVLTGYYKEFTPFLSMYCGFPDQTMRRFRMRTRSPNCVVCSDKKTISRHLIETHAIDYQDFCGAIDYQVDSDASRMSVQDLSQRSKSNRMPLILDVRPIDQYNIVSFTGSINLAWTRLAKMDSIDEFLPRNFDKAEELVVMCRYGNDSRLAARKLKSMGFTNVHDVVGGINKWASDVDPTMPIY